MNRDHLHSASHQSSAHNHPRTESRAPLNPSNDGADPSASSSAHRQSPSNDIALPPLSSLSSTQQLISGAIQFQTLANHHPPPWASISQGGAQPSTFALNGIGSHNPTIITQTLSWQSPSSAGDQVSISTPCFRVQRRTPSRYNLMKNDLIRHRSSYQSSPSHGSGVLALPGYA